MRSITLELHLHTNAIVVEVSTYNSEAPDQERWSTLDRWEWPFGDKVDFAEALTLWESYAIDHARSVGCQEALPF